jgi:hypothetical protein
VGYTGEKHITVPEHSVELAEFIGIMLGDGSSYYCHRSRSWQIRIVGHSEEADYYVGFIAPLCEKLFGFTPRIRYLTKQKAIVLVLDCKALVLFLSDVGFPPGNKTVRQAATPEWIFSHQEYMRACMRGLLDTDGSIYLMGKWMQMEFKNASFPLLEDFRRIGSELGFFVSKRSGRQVYISRRSHIDKYINEVGFHNPKHIRRYMRFTAP